jgi:hypothetical protein
MTKANEGESSRPHSQEPQSFGHCSQKKTFLLRLKSGLKLRIRAQGVARSGNHLCLVICSELECDRGVFHFLSNKRPFLTILNAVQYKLKISGVRLD